MLMSFIKRGHHDCGKPFLGLEVGEPLEKWDNMMNPEEEPSVPPKELHCQRQLAWNM